MPAPSFDRRPWRLDPSVVFLNHGSFGACPEPVLAAQAALRERLERNPMDFFLRAYEGLLDTARARLAGFLHADPAGLLFVNNATQGVNTVLRSLRLLPGDEILLTDHGYNAVGNAARAVAEPSGARVVLAGVPFPLASAEIVVERVLAALTPRTRLVIADHVTSPTGLVLPIERLAPLLAERGVELLVDGAHGPGMLPLDLGALAVPYYTGNCHKWLCAPKGAAFLHVREDRRARIVPLAVSHGRNATRTDRARLLLEFDWPGTHDPTAWMCLPAALDALAGMRPGGWPAVMADNRQKALAAREQLCTAFGCAPPSPPEMIGALAAVPLPPSRTGGAAAALQSDPLQARLWSEHRIEVPVPCWPAPPQRLLRISAQLYNRPEEYALLARAVLHELQQEGAAAEHQGAAS